MNRKNYMLSILVVALPITFFGQQWTAQKKISIVSSILKGYIDSSSRVIPDTFRTDNSAYIKLCFDLVYPADLSDSLRVSDMVFMRLRDISETFICSQRFEYYLSIQMKELGPDSGKVNKYTMGGSIYGGFKLEPAMLRQSFLNLLPFYPYYYLSGEYDCFTLWEVSGVTPAITDADYFGLVAAMIHYWFPSYSSSTSHHTTGERITYIKNGKETIYEYPPGTNYEKYLNRIED